MSSLVAPEVDCDRHHTSLCVSDLPAAVAFYTAKLGFRVGFTEGDPPVMAGMRLGEAQVFLEQGTPNPAGCALYFVVGDADELCAFHRAAGVEVLQPPGDREYGLRDYTIRDLHGYSLSFGHPTYTGGPPLPIERVEVPVRLEKRLAALLHDLAAHKRMTLTGCLEEILLHTCEPLGDGVASPHTRSHLRHIQKLKAKHGIDYDSHASYRFVEIESDLVPRDDA
jgi:catechol 2,3-dioxygenase-like lactoylglutathione lyase family enzyme